MAEAVLPDDDRDLNPTAPFDDVVPEPPPAGFSTVRLFGSPSFFRLWLAQVMSSLGDWIGFVAITALAARIAGGGSPEAAVGLVLSARLVPGFFLAPVAGVLVDRWNRRRVMVVCDVGRGLVLATLPWVRTIPGLVVVSLLLEVFTLLWSPAKEASVPRLVPERYLPTANSLSLVAAYGTFPIGSALFAALAGVAKFLARYDALEGLEVDQEFVAIYFDVGTFLLSALIISTLALPRGRPSRSAGPAGSAAAAVAARSPARRGLDFGQAWRDLREGFSFIGHNPIVRAVMLSIATGLVGGGMLVPLGPAFARETLGGGSASFGLLLTAMGLGVATGIVGLSVVQRHLPHERVFLFAVFGCGASILVGASLGDIRGVLAFVALLGVCAGAVYVLGFTILQTNVEDALRGRIFATLNSVVRFCLLSAFAIAPLLASLLGRAADAWFDGEVGIGSANVAVTGARLTLWLGGLIILAAGGVALLALRERRPGRTP
ncbi:MAG TPA: MFS transporter [Acidimicrobiales bacterium]